MPFCRYCGEEIFENIPHECEKKTEEKAKPTATAAEMKLDVEMLKGYIRKAGDILSALVQRMGLKDSKIDYNERDKQIVPDSLALEDGEIPVKQYDHLATLQTKVKLCRAIGRLQITNKRVLFRANGFSPAGKTVYQQVFDLDKLDGVEIRKDFRFRFGDTLYAFLLSYIVFFYAGGLTSSVFSASWCYPIMVALALLSCVPVFLWKGKWMEKFLILCLGFACMESGVHNTPFSWLIERDLQMLGAGTSFLSKIMVILYFVCVIMYSFKPNLLIEFKCGAGNAIQIRHVESMISKEKFSGFAEIQPGKDADEAIREVNTIINEIKTLGDLGIEKWKDNK